MDAEKNAAAVRCDNSKKKRLLREALSVVILFLCSITMVSCGKCSVCRAFEVAAKKVWQRLWRASSSAGIT